MAVYYLSDLHLLHRSVALRRGFPSVQDHDRTVLENLARRVGANDTLFLLGDLFAYTCDDALLGQLDRIHDRLFVEMDREELHAAASGYRELIRRLDVLHGEMLADIEISDPRVELVYRLADIMTPLRNFVPGGEETS